MAITTQPLNDKQKEFVAAHHLAVTQSKIAYDRLRLIVNKANTDTVINLEELRGIVQGRITDWKQLEVTHRSGKLSLVFDASGSSTVRYMKDSLNGGKELKGNIFAQGSNLKVIEAVKENPNVIGVVSTDWLRQQKGDSTTIQSFQGLDVNVMLVGKLGKKSGRLATSLPILYCHRRISFGAQRVGHQHRSKNAQHAQVFLLLPQRQRGTTRDLQLFAAPSAQSSASKRGQCAISCTLFSRARRVRKNKT